MNNWIKWSLVGLMLMTGCNGYQRRKIQQTSDGRYYYTHQNSNGDWVIYWYIMNNNSSPSYSDFHNPNNWGNPSTISESEVAAFDSQVVESASIEVSVDTNGETSVDSFGDISGDTGYDSGSTDSGSDGGSDGGGDGGGCN